MEESSIGCFGWSGSATAEELMKKVGIFRWKMPYIFARMGSILVGFLKKEPGFFLCANEWSKNADIFLQIEKGSLKIQVFFYLVENLV